MPRMNHAAALATIAGLAVGQAATAAVVLDFSAAPGVTVGDQLVSNANPDAAADSGTSLATFTLDDPAATLTTLSLSYTGEGGSDPSANLPQLRSFANGGVGINSSLPNGNDTNTALDELGANPGSADESLTFSFSNQLFVRSIGLTNFSAGEELIVTSGSSSLFYGFADTVEAEVAGETVRLLTLPTALDLAAGDSFTLTVADDGDDTNRADIQVHRLRSRRSPSPPASALPLEACSASQHAAAAEPVVAFDICSPFG